MAFRGKSLGHVLSLALGAVLAGVAAVSAFGSDNLVGGVVWTVLAGLFVYFLLRHRSDSGTSSRGSVLFGIAFLLVGGTLALYWGITDDRPERVLALLSGAIALPLGVWGIFLARKNWDTMTTIDAAPSQKE